MSGQGEWGRGGWTGVQGKKRNGWTVRAIILISDILYHPYIHYYKLSSKKNIPYITGLWLMKEEQ